MEDYNKDVATNDKVEMVHISRDRDDKAALKWAQDSKLPWPTIMAGDAKAPLMEHYGNAVPGFVLVDREGKKVAAGKGAIWAKLKSL